MKRLLKNHEEIEFSAKFLKKIFEDLNHRVFEKKIPNLDFRLKLEKSLGLSFDASFFCFGPKVFDYSPLDVVVSVFHEMVHASNFTKGLRDVGRNSYHNKNFLEECNRKGLLVLRHKSQGWSIVLTHYPRNVVDTQNVSPHPEEDIYLNTVDTINCIIQNSDWEKFYSQKVLFSKKEYTYKYVCSCPPPFNSIRSGRGPESMNPLLALCRICGQEYTCKDG